MSRTWQPIGRSANHRARARRNQNTPNADGRSSLERAKSPPNQASQRDEFASQASVQSSARTIGWRSTRRDPAGNARGPRGIATRTGLQGARAPVSAPPTPHPCAPQPRVRLKLEVVRTNSKEYLLLGVRCRRRQAFWVLDCNPVSTRQAELFSQVCQRFNQALGEGARWRTGNPDDEYSASCVYVPNSTLLKYWK